MAKKDAYTMVKLISQAKSGTEKYFRIPRKTPERLNLILYDPRVRRHCLFVEDKKRKIAHREHLVKAR